MQRVQTILFASITNLVLRPRAFLNIGTTDGKEKLVKGYPSKTNLEPDHRVVHCYLVKPETQDEAHCYGMEWKHG
jgi:hypothetical protein